MMIREIVVEPQAIAWLPWAVSYFFFIGLSFSSVFVGLLTNYKEKNLRTEFIAIAIALTCSIVAPIALTADLHQPSRIANFYLNLTPWSWMAWGAIFLPLFTVAVAGYFLCLLRQVVPQNSLPKFLHLLYWGNLNITRWTTVFRLFAFVMSLLILVYTTMEVYVVEARPLWHHYGLMPLILFSALPSAFLLCRFFSTLFAQQNNPTYFSHFTALSLVALCVTLLTFYFSSEQTALQLTQLWHFSNLPLLAIACLVALFVLVYLPHSMLYNLAAVVAALCLTWLVRWILLIQVQSVAKYNALMNPYQLGWHIDSAIGILSVFSLWICIGILLWWLFSAALLQKVLLEAKMNNQRRNLLKGGLALGTASAFIAGYSPKVKEIATGIIEGTSGEHTADKINGNSLLPEYQVQNGQLISNGKQVVCNTQCMGCWTLCGLRARVDLETNQVIRINGNPYHPLSADKYLDFNQSIKEAELSVTGENGLENRSTACARGAAFLEGINSPYRITQPLKRVGKRGEGKWKTISFEQLVDEVVNGGDLFGEGHVDGLKAIRDLKTPVDSENPDFGAKVNQLMVTFAGPEGRQPLLKRFANNSFGTINFASHGSFCGLSYRAGSGAFMNDLANNSHAKPDWDHAEFILFMGTSPAQAGNPFKRQARQLAKQRTEDHFDYVVVAPRLELTNSRAVKQNRWVPIMPGTDLSLSLAMLRWIIENERYNAAYLAIPSEDAMQKANGVSFCNATHLFIADPAHKRYGQAIRLHDLLEMPVPEKNTDGDIIVKDQLTGEFIAAKDCESAVIFVEDFVTLKDGSQVLAKSAMQLFKESCFEHSLEEYSAHCGVPTDTIIQLAKEFTSHGHRAAAITHGGTMHGAGFYTAWAILLLNAMVGNMNKKGGMSMSGGKFKDFGGGPRYDLANFPNMVKPKGTNLARSKKAYENSSEFKRKVEQGVSPYPAKASWYPFVGGQMSEMITSALQGYPYSLKAWISHMSNPIYGMTGIHHITDTKLRDPKILPLFIAVDAFMNETTALADYIVPDTHNFESWGFSTPWAGVPTKASTARWPVIQSKNARTANGDVVCMESFIIAVAKAMNLPGFGDNAIMDKQQNSYPLNCTEDFFLRAAANIAYDGKEPVKDASIEDLLLTGVQRLIPKLEQTLKPEEVLKVANVYCKGGRFAPHKSAWQEDNMQARWKNCLQIWNETVAKAKHSQTGKHYHGCPKYFLPQFADNSTLESHYPSKEWPFKLISFKSNLMSSITAPLLRLHSIKPEGLVAMNQQDATEQGLKHGDLVSLMTPGGQQNVQIVVMDGVMKGTIAIEHGYGHKQLGATSYVIDGIEISGNSQIKRGININDLGILDITKEIVSPWVDWVCGSAVRQGIPAKLNKVL